MLSPKRTIFRKVALEHYMQHRSRDILPRYISPPIFLLFWCFCVLGAGVLLIAWNVQLPLYQEGVAVIMVAPQTPALATRSADAQALVFFAPAQKNALHQGMPVTILVNTTETWQQRLTELTPEPLSPQIIRDEYHLDAHLSLLVTQPALVAVIPLQRYPQAQRYIGALLQVHVQIGTQSLLSLLPLPTH